MRILVWSETYWPNIGGVEVLLHQVNTALQQRGHGLAVIAGRWRSEMAEHEVHAGVPIYRLPFGVQLNLRNLPEQKRLGDQLKEIVQDFKPELHHVHISSGEPTLFFFRRTQADSRIPMLLTLHAWMLPPRNSNSLVGQSLRQAQWVTAVSESILNEARQLTPTIGPNSSVIHNGLPWPEVEPTPLPMTPPRLLCLGRLVPEKGFDLALTAFEQIRAKFPQAQLVVAGDGTAKAELEQQAHGLGLADSVQFLGWVEPDAVPDLINSAALVIMPSRWAEPFGLVALQAAQMARPIVATRVGGLPEVVTDSVTGRLVKPDSDSIAEAVLMLLNDPSRATQMGLTARRKAQEKFSLAGCVDAYEALYTQLSRP